MQLDMSKVMSIEEIENRINKMNSYGPRTTGNKAHQIFIEDLKKSINEMGIKSYSDTYHFHRWEEKKSSLILHNENEDTNIHISSAFPYSGYTDEQGITAELAYLPSKHIGFAFATGKIALVDVGALSLPTTIVENQRNSKPEGTKLSRKYGGPVLTTFVNFPLLKTAKAVGVKAVICVWKGFSDASIEGQYLPFIMDYQGLPAIWVNEADGKTLREAAKLHKEVTLTLEADYEKNAPTETFYAIMEGKNKDEAMIINTHTDGTNCVEENGGIGLLALMRYLKDIELERTIIFVFMTGHFRLPALKAKGSTQVTSRWLSDHKELWNGRNGHIKAVAGLTVEHLGCTEWSDNCDGEYTKSNDIEIELCYTGNKKLDSIYYEALEDRKLVRTITYRGHNFLHFGEGQPLFEKGIPTISIVPGPTYLCVQSATQETEKFSAELMYEQIITFLKSALIIDKTPRKNLGRANGYSILIKAKGLE